MASEAPDLAALAGLWRRALLVAPDGSCDRTTIVRWLQGPSLYADLRQPAAPPDWRTACLRDLLPEQIAWLARQEAFAGALRVARDAFEWQRSIDFQPAASQADAGRLRFDRALLIEQGRDVPYIEHWQRHAAAPHPCAALRLRDRETGCAGVLVRVGAIFMVARGRTTALPPRCSLAELVAGAASLRDAQALVDCEISLGRIDPFGWLIERSSLPFKVGLRLAPHYPPRTDSLLQTDDLRADGRPWRRAWDIEAGEGDVARLLSPCVELSELCEFQVPS